MSTDPPITGPYPTPLPSGQGLMPMPLSANDLLKEIQNSQGDKNLSLGSSAPGDTMGNNGDNSAARQDFVDQYVPLIKSVQDRRRKVEEEWLRNLDSWKGRHRHQGFKGEWFNHFIPASRRATERFVIRCKQMLFPSPDFFEVYPSDEARQDLGKQAESWKNFLLWRLSRARIRNVIAQALRCYCLYQRAIVKTFLDFEEIPGQVWPSVRPVDPFMVYIWPETASMESQFRVVFEHTMMPFNRYRMMAEQGVADIIKEVDLTKPEWPYYYVERLGQTGITPPTDVRSGKANDTEDPALTEPQKMVSMTEVWRRDDSTFTQLWIVWNVTGGPKCVRMQSNQMLPYHFAIARQIPGENYTNGMMSDLEPLNIILNDTTNMTLEGQATTILPPAVVDPDRVSRSESLVFRPRAKWLAQPEGVKWMDPPAGNALGAGYQGIQMIMGMMDSFSGSNPLAEGQPTRGMPRAGFAVSSMLGLSMSDIRDVAETFEDNILTPMLQSMYRMTITGGIPMQQIAAIPGAEAIMTTQLNIADLQSGRSFRWVGSLQFQDQNVRAQRMLTLMGQFAKLYPPMKAAGYDLDFAVLGKKMWRDSLGERGADSIIKYTGPPPPPPPPHSEPPKISVSLSGQLDPVTANALANPAPPPPPPPMPGAPNMAARPPQPGPIPPNVQKPMPMPQMRAPSTGGAEAPAPSTPEQSERQMGRNMAENSVGKTLAGTGVG